MSTTQGLSPTSAGGDGDLPDLPYTDTQGADLVRAVEQVRADGQIRLMLGPFAGLAAVTEQGVRQGGGWIRPSSTPPGYR